MIQTSIMHTSAPHTYNPALRAISLKMSRMRHNIARRTGLNSIHGRLIGTAFIFIIGIAVAMGITGYRFTASFERQRFHEHFNLLAGYMADNAELGVMMGDPDMLQRLCKSMLQVKDVQSVVIFDAAGKQIVRSGTPTADEYATVSAPVKSQVMDEAALFSDTSNRGKHLGRIEVTYSLSGLHQLQHKLALRYTIISLVLSLAPVVMYWMLARSISAPLKQLVKVAQRVSRGKMNVRAKGGTLVETRTLAQAINEMLATLEERRLEIQRTNAAMARQQVLAEVGKFSMMVAHEIKNPLAIIKGSMDILSHPQHNSPEVQARMVGYINDEIERMNKLIEDFLMFSRPRDPDFKFMEVDEFVTRMLHKVALVESSIRIDKQLQPAVVKYTVACDIIQFERALLNVVRNAMEACKNAADVSVTVNNDTQWLSFSVCDAGPGIDSSKIQRLFDPFYSTKAKGTGLGLALVKDVVKAHKGQIKVANIATGGACFILQLPIRPQTENHQGDIEPPNVSA